jgi:hypothetical protein
MLSHDRSNLQRGGRVDRQSSLVGNEPVQASPVAARVLYTSRSATLHSRNKDGMRFRDWNTSAWMQYPAGCMEGMSA